MQLSAASKILLFHEFHSRNREFYFRVQQLSPIRAVRHERKSLGLAYQRVQAPAATKTSSMIPVVEVKRIDPCLSSRIHEYPGLAKGTKVLVTTGGAIADYAISLLTAAGCVVTVLGSSPHPSRVAARDAKPEITLVEGSVASPEACAKAVIGQDVVLYAGRPATASEACRSAHEGTRQLLSAAASAGVKAFIFASSAR